MPIFSRSWLMKMTAVRERLMAAVSLRSAWDIRRACRPGRESPISPFDLGPRHEGGHAVDDDDVHGVAAHQGLGDLQRLLAGVRLGDQQVVDLDAAGRGVGGVEGVLDVDVGGQCRPSSAPRR